MEQIGMSLEKYFMMITKMDLQTKEKVYHEYRLNSSIIIQELVGLKLVIVMEILVSQKFQKEHIISK
jgi:hypothetical protein